MKLSGMDLGQYWIRLWLGAVRTNVELSSARPSDIHLRAISQEISSITKIGLKFTYLKSHSNLSGVNELIGHSHMQYNYDTGVDHSPPNIDVTMIFVSGKFTSGQVGTLLTRCAQVTPNIVIKVNIGWGNGLSTARRQAIPRSNSSALSFGPME